MRVYIKNYRSGKFWTQVPPTKFQNLLIYEQYNNNVQSAAK